MYVHLFDLQCLTCTSKTYHIYIDLEKEKAEEFHTELLNQLPICTFRIKYWYKMSTIAIVNVSNTIHDYILEKSPIWFE